MEMETETEIDGRSLAENLSPREGILEGGT